MTHDPELEEALELASRRLAAQLSIIVDRPPTWIGVAKDTVKYHRELLEDQRAELAAVEEEMVAKGLLRERG